MVLNIPRGLPKVTVKDWLPLQYSDTLVPLAFVVMMVDMLESTTIARALARKNGYKLIFNRCDSRRPRPRAQCCGNRACWC